MYNQYPNNQPQYPGSQGQPMYPQQQQQPVYQQYANQKPQLDPRVSFKVAVDIKQSKYPDRMTGQMGQYVQLNIKYAAKQDKGADFSLSLNFGQTKFGTMGGFTVVSVDKLLSLYQAIGYALQQQGVLPQPPQPVAPLANQQPYTPQPQAAQKPPVLTDYASILALCNWSKESADAYCHANNVAHLIPNGNNSSSSNPTSTVANPVTTEEIPY